MKKKIISALILLVLAGGLFWYFSGDRVNQLARLEVAHIDADYQVTWASYNGDKVYNVKDGKVTAMQSKGYYFFWAEATDGKGKKRYVQVPIASTQIVEVH